MRNPSHRALVQVGLGLLGLASSMQVVVAPSDPPIGWLLISLVVAGIAFLVRSSAVATRSC